MLISLLCFSDYFSNFFYKCHAFLPHFLRSLRTFLHDSAYACGSQCPANCSECKSCCTSRQTARRMDIHTYIQSLYNSSRAVIVVFIACCQQHWCLANDCDWMQRVAGCFTFIYIFLCCYYCWLHSSFHNNTVERL